MQSVHLFLLILSLFLSIKCQNKSASADQNLLAVCTTNTAEGLQSKPGPDGRIAPLFEDLGNLTYPINTNSPDAQRYFDQGMMLAYGFNHAEAARSFREALRRDPECVMCYWGLGWVLGPNYNAGMEKEVLSTALEAIANAKMRLQNTNPKEQALVKALDQRYPPDLDTDPQPYYLAFAQAMREVKQAYPDDVTILLITAEALMNLHPWDLWEKDGRAKPWTSEILALAEEALQLSPNHPQGLHIYIHAYEAGNQPEKAIPQAQKLEYLIPGSGHLVHMPSHIYINTGHFHEGAEANERAVKVDSAYVETCHAAGIYPLAYYPHNWHFLAACAALEGKGRRAVEASRYMADYTVDKNLLREPGLGTLQHYYMIPAYIMVKFARWDEILREPMPADDLLYPRGILHYARGMALANQQNIPAAQLELKELERIASIDSMQKITIWDINSVAELLHIARFALRGEIAFKQNKFAEAIKHYQKAVELEDKLNYNEPPDWFFSLRHPLGHVLLQAGKYREAEQVFRQDLTEFKNNGWALQGLYRALLKQKKDVEADKVMELYQEAWKYADQELKSSVIM